MTGKLNVKVDEVSKEIAAREITITSAKRPARPSESEMIAKTVSPQITPLWSTGNSGIDELIHKSGTRYGVDPYRFSHPNPSPARTTSRYSVTGAILYGEGRTPNE